MDRPVRRNVVVSAVNIRKGGTLTILRACLGYLATREDLRVTALVHRRALADFPGIDYIELPHTIESWRKRLRCEYREMYAISRKLAPVDLWFSLHDTTPRVEARRQAVYCHTSFPFLKTRWRDWRMDWKIPMFAHFTKYAYRHRVSANSYLVVQQNWFREGLTRLTRFPKERIVVAPPAVRTVEADAGLSLATPPLFLYPATPDCHKNFEVVCRAAERLEQQLGPERFRICFTCRGDENRYARWLKKRWGHVVSLDFHGLMPREELDAVYQEASCLLFPSRIETWGLPVSEFKPTGRPMILADLPYAHESAAGASCVAFFPPDDEKALMQRIIEVICGQFINFAAISPQEAAPPRADDWQQLFEILLRHDEDTAAR